MLRRLCPNVAFLSARPIGLSREDLLAKWPQLERVHAEEPFARVDFLSGTFSGSVVGTFTCQTIVEDTPTKKRTGCQLMADDKVTNFKKFIERYPQFNHSDAHIFLHGDNGQGDYAAWKEIKSLDSLANIHAFIHKTLTESCDESCRIRPAEQTWGWEQGDNAVEFVDGWRCVVRALLERGYLQESDGQAIEERMIHEIQDIYHSGVNEAHFQHWVNHEYDACADQHLIA